MVEVRAVGASLGGSREAAKVYCHTEKPRPQLKRLRSQCVEAPFTTVMVGFMDPKGWACGPAARLVAL